MCATLAGTPSLSYRLKSTNRYACLWPPPMCRVVILPVLLRPPVFGLGTSSDFSGVERVSSTKSATLAPRRPGVVGLYLRIAMSFVRPLYASAGRRREDVDPLAVGNGHDRAFGVGALPEAAPGPAYLALPVDRVHPGDLHAENGFHRDLDLGLIGLWCDEEGVLVLVQQAIALLAHHWGQQDVAMVADFDAGHFWSSSIGSGPELVARGPELVATGSELVDEAGRASTGSAGVSVGSTRVSAGEFSWSGWASSGSSGCFGSWTGAAGGPDTSEEAIRAASVSRAMAFPDFPAVGPAMKASSAAEVKTTSSLTNTS